MVAHAAPRLTDQGQRRLGGTAALVPLVGPRPRHRLLLGVDRENAVAHGEFSRQRQIHQAARRLARHDVVMAGLAADHAAERDHAVISLALLLGRRERDGDGGGNFQRTRHADAVECGTGRVKRARRALQQHVGNVVIESRLDHEDARIVQGELILGGNDTRLGHDAVSVAHAVGWAKHCRWAGRLLRVCNQASASRAKPTRSDRPHGGHRRAPPCSTETRAKRLSLPYERSINRAA